jgi:hypothetical protein
MTGCHLSLVKKPAAITLNGSAITPNIHKGLGSKTLPMMLPIKAAMNPARGPRTVPSIGDK